VRCCNRVGLRRKLSLPEGEETVPARPEDGDVAALGRDVEPPQRRVEGENVRIGSDGGRARHLHAAEVEREQGRVPVSWS